MLQPNCMSGVGMWMTPSQSFQEFTDHINSQSQHIKFTIEAERDGQLPFLDTLVILNDDGTLKTKIYCKPTHTDQYLNWDSNHQLEHKRLVVQTLLRRAETVTSKPEDVREEVNHIKKVLRVNGYKKCSFRIPKKKAREEDTTEGPTANKHLVCIPYISGLSEQLQRVFRSHSVPSYHKPCNILSSLLVSPKEKQEVETMWSGVQC